MIKFFANSSSASAIAKILTMSEEVEKMINKTMIIGIHGPIFLNNVEKKTVMDVTKI